MCCTWISLFSTIFMFAGYYLAHWSKQLPYYTEWTKLLYFFIPIITAISATTIIFILLHKLDSIPIVRISLAYLGQYSLIIMIFHTYIKSSWIKGIPLGLSFCILLSIIRIIICVCLIEVIRRVPILNKIYGIVTH